MNQANNLAQVDVLADLRGVVRIAKAASVGVTGNGPRIQRAEQAIVAVAELVAAARGACNTLRESAKQHRLAGDAGHASHCETLADHTDAALRPFTGSDKA